MTHVKWVCPLCGSETWIPEGKLGTQANHANRPFCGCDEQGIRMTPKGRVEL